MSKRFTTLGRYPSTRLRRNRREEWSRRLVAEHKLSVDDLIWPVFVQEGQNARTPVDSMPGVDRLTIDLFVEAAREARDLGIPAIAIFPETDPKSKTPDAREAYNPGNLVCRAITAVKKAVSGAKACSSSTSAACASPAMKSSQSFMLAKEYTPTPS